MPITKTIANGVLDHLVGRTESCSVVDQVYVGLSTTTPTTDGTGVTEPIGNGYCRMPIATRGQPPFVMYMSAAAEGASHNTSEIHFFKAQASWGTITHVCFFSDQTEGELIAYGPLTTPTNVVENDVVVIDVGDLSVTLA